MNNPQGVEIRAPLQPGFERILSPEALALVARLHRAFEPRRQELLASRVERAKRLDAGEKPDFLPQTRSVREGNWTIAPVPADLQRRRVEITGPVERKMIINALNSGADSYMTDFEDSNAPNWDRSPQLNLITRSAPFAREGGKTYKLNTPCDLVFAARRHLDEKHAVRKRVSGGIFEALSCHNRRSWVFCRPTSTCPRWNRISKPGSGTTSSSRPSASSEFRRERSRRLC
jgi:malate synthase